MNFASVVKNGIQCYEQKRSSEVKSVKCLSNHVQHFVKVRNFSMQAFQETPGLVF